MPPPYVRTVEDLIFYYYAKLVIAPAAGFAGNYRFITSTFKKLKSGKIKISDYDREILKQMQCGASRCVYCGYEGGTLTKEHIIPLEHGGPDEPHNIVFACKHCNSSKGNDDLMDWWVNKLGKPLDDLPRIPIGLYLKLCYDAHKLRHSLSRTWENPLKLWPFGPSTLYGRGKSRPST